jgi:hypothetical protein
MNGLQGVEQSLKTHKSFGMPTVNQTQERRYYPMLFVDTQEGVPFDVLSRMWQRYAQLSQETKNILKSDEIVELIVSIQNKLSIDDDAIGKVTKTIRGLLLGDFDISNLEVKLTAELSSIGMNDPVIVASIVKFIREDVLTLRPKPVVDEPEEESKVKPQRVLEKMPLLQALSKYENLGNQLITNERIKIKSQPEPVRPSLLYWIKYYRDELGIGHHSTVDRGNFLFRSENGKRLTAPERERVNLVLKSVEENYPVDIDTERSEIIFPAFVEPTPRPQPIPQPAPTPVTAPVTPRPKPAFNFGQGGMISGAEVKKGVASAPTPGNLSFTSKHVFPAEKPATPAPTASPRPGVTAPRPVTQTIQPPTNPFRINPVSLGKVKDEE